MPQAAAVLLCLVIGISDGDTLTARCDTPDGPENLKLRLAEIDAPESHQPWGQRSRQALAALCLLKQADVHSSGTDRHGRLIARVSCAGVDSSVEQVRTGMAWVYDRYVVDHKLYEDQQEAQQARVGLWHDEAPVPPWIWRREHRRTQ